MKRRICVTILFLAVAAATFAAPAWLPDFRLSTGAGGVFGGHFTDYNMQAGGILDADQNINQFELGAFAFFDATFVTFGVAIQHGWNRFDEPVRFDVPFPIPDPSRDGRGQETTLALSLLARWPFRLNNTITVFPLAGIDYSFSLRYRRTDPDGNWYNRDNREYESDRDGNAFSFSDFNAFIVRVGGGAEFDITDRIFLRGDLLLGIRLRTEWERKNLDAMQSQAMGIQQMMFLPADDSTSLSGISLGPSLRLGVGWRI